jgi:UDP-glucose 4-epimerase
MGGAGYIKSQATVVAGASEICAQLDWKPAYDDLHTIVARASGLGAETAKLG